PDPRADPSQPRSELQRPARRPRPHGGEPREPRGKAARSRLPRKPARPGRRALRAPVPPDAGRRAGVRRVPGRAATHPPSVDDPRRADALATGRRGGPRAPAAVASPGGGGIRLEAKTLL